jgi:K+/H+ antiporter YhaU regulatory subunit KhtT
VTVRRLLLDKHRAIVKLILNNHKDNCLEICQYIENEFKLINKQLNKRPENVEELVELETYMTGIYICKYACD